MDPIDVVNLIPAEWRSYILLIIGCLTAALPLMQWVANKTANTWDNALVARVEWLLAHVPRLSTGNTRRAREAVARSSKRPPPPAGALLVLPLLLLGCGQDLSPRDARLAASQMRDDLARVGGVIEFARNAQPLLCSLQPGELCDTLTDSIPVIVAAHKAAQTAVDVVEVSGVASDQIAMQVRACLEQAHALGETVKAFGKAVADAMGQERSRDSVGPVLQPPTASPGGSPAPGATAAP